MPTKPTTQKKSGTDLKKSPAAKTQTRPAKPATSVKLADAFDLSKMMRGYNVESTRISLVNYITDSIRWFDGLLALLKSLTDKHRPQIVAIQNLVGDLSTYEEHPDLNDRSEYLSLHLSFGIDILQKKLLCLKHEFIIWEDALYSANTLDALCKLESRKRPEFSLVVGHSFALIKRYMHHFDWLLEQQKPLTMLVKLHHDWCNDFHTFDHSTYSHFMKMCQKKKIPKLTAESIFSEWKKSRLLIEKHLFELVKATIDVKVIPIETALKAASILKVYLLDKLHDFYSGNRIDLHINRALQPGFEILERFEKDAELVRINAGFQIAFESLIFKTVTIEGRLFLARWAEEWCGNVISDVIASIERGTLQELVAKTILDEFMTMKQRNLEAFLIDAKSYAEAREQKNNEFNALMYRMLQDLSQLCTNDEKRE
jgi:hypothetical protein